MRRSSIVGWIALSHGLIDHNGKPLGTDFSSFYAAGSLALEGRAAGVYDMATHYAREQQIFGAGDALLWLALSAVLSVVAAPLALMPYPSRSRSGRRHAGALFGRDRR